MVMAILQALVAIPKIGGLIKNLIDLWVIWNNEHKRKELEEATIDLQNAKTNSERSEAIRKWARAVSG